VRVEGVHVLPDGLDLAVTHGEDADAVVAVRRGRPRAIGLRWEVAALDRSDAASEEKAGRSET
jgi:hypothetical protein